jgi:hypothetical protein
VIARERIARLLPALWAGALLAIALLAAPAAFGAVTAEQAGRVVARLFAQEARLSLFVATAVVLVERWRGVRSFNSTILLALGALFCTVAGYYALQPLMDAARAGRGSWTFGQLHAASLLFYALKTVIVGALAWRALSAPAQPS